MLKKMLNRINVIMCTLLCAIITSSCIDDNDAVETETMSIPVNLYIPMNQDVTTKTPGDPGTYEQFALPEYLYLYLVLNYTDEGGTKTKVFRAGESGVVNLDPEKWSKKEFQRKRKFKKVLAHYWQRCYNEPTF